MKSLTTLLRLLISFVYLAGLLLGLFVAVVAPFQMYEKAQAESWPSHRGVITKSIARQEFNFGMGRNGSPYWEAKICGRYQNDNDAFCIRRINLGLHVGDQTQASVLETVAHYPVGREVDVYYSPDDPKNTLLEAHSSWHEMIIALGVALAFLLSPVLLRMFRKKSEPE